MVPRSKHRISLTWIPSWLAFRMVSMVPPVVLLESTMASTDTLAFPDRRFFATSISLVFRSSGCCRPWAHRILLPDGIEYTVPSQRYCSMLHRGFLPKTLAASTLADTKSQAQESGPLASPAIKWMWTFERAMSHSSSAMALKAETRTALSKGTWSVPSNERDPVMTTTIIAGSRS